MKTELEGYLDQTRHRLDRRFVYLNARKLIPTAEREISRLSEIFDRMALEDRPEFEKTFLAPIDKAIREVNKSLRDMSDKFQIGAQVWIKSGKYLDRFRGCIGTIYAGTKVGSSGPPDYHVRFGNKDSVVVMEDDLDIYEAEEKKKYYANYIRNP